MVGGSTFVGCVCRRVRLVSLLASLVIRRRGTCTTSLPGSLAWPRCSHPLVLASRLAGWLAGLSVAASINSIYVGGLSVVRRVDRTSPGAAAKGELTRPEKTSISLTR